MRQKIKWERESERLWRQLGANGNYSGFWSAICATAKLVEDPELVNYVCKGLYLETAKDFGSTPKCVEKNIRRLKEKIWSYGDRELLAEIFGKEVLGGRAPANRAFLDVLAAYLREKLEETVREES